MRIKRWKVTYFEWCEDHPRGEALMAVRNAADIAIKVGLEQGICEELLSTSVSINGLVEAKA